MGPITCHGLSWCDVSSCRCTCRVGLRSF